MLRKVGPSDQSIKQQGAEPVQRPNDKPTSALEAIDSLIALIEKRLPAPEREAAGHGKPAASMNKPSRTEFVKHLNNAEAPKPIIYKQVREQGSEDPEASLSLLSEDEIESFDATENQKRFKGGHDEAEPNDSSQFVPSKADLKDNPQPESAFGDGSKGFAPAPSKAERPKPAAPKSELSPSMGTDELAKVPALPHRAIDDQVELDPSEHNVEATPVPPSSGSKPTVSAISLNNEDVSADDESGSDSNDPEPTGSRASNASVNELSKNRNRDEVTDETSELPPHSPSIRPSAKKSLSPSPDLAGQAGKPTGSPLPDIESIATQHVPADDRHSSTDEDELEVFKEDSKNSKTELNTNVLLDKPSRVSNKRIPSGGHRKSPPMVLQEEIVKQTAAKNQGKQRLPKGLGNPPRQAELPRRRLKEEILAKDDMLPGQDLEMVTAIGSSVDNVKTAVAEATTLEQVNVGAVTTRKLTGPTSLLALTVGLFSSWGKGARWAYRKWVMLRKVNKEINALTKQVALGGLAGETAAKRLAELKLLKKDLKEQTEFATWGNLAETSTWVAANTGAAAVGIKAGIFAQSSTFGNTLKDIVLNEPLSKSAAASGAGVASSALSAVAGVILFPLFAASAKKKTQQIDQLEAIEKKWKDDNSRPTQMVLDGPGDSGKAHKVAKLVESKVEKNKLMLKIGRGHDILLSTSGLVSGVFGIAAVAAGGATIAGAPIVLPIASAVATVAACTYLGFRAYRHIKSKISKWNYRRARNAIASELENHSKQWRFGFNRRAVKKMKDAYNEELGWKRLPSIDKLNENHMRIILAHINNKMLERDTRTATNEIYRQVKDKPLPTKDDYEQGRNLDPAAALLKSVGMTFDDFEAIKNSSEPVRAMNALAGGLLLV